MGQLAATATMGVTLAACKFGYGHRLEELTEAQYRQALEVQDPYSPKH